MAGGDQAGIKAVPEVVRSTPKGNLSPGHTTFLGNLQQDGFEADNGTPTTSSHTLATIGAGESHAKRRVDSGNVVRSTT
jgi:hypothetical protein